MVSILEYPHNLLKTEKIQSIHIEASRALSKLDGILEIIPNINVLMESIPLQEARLSNCIENIVTSSDDVFRAYSAGEGEIDANVRDVLSYRNGLMIVSGKTVTLSLIEEICSVVKRKEMHIRSTRDDVVFLRDVYGNIISTPPAGNDVPGLLRELIGYATGGADDPLLRMVVFHGMFEMIHPFKDGNGRIGRILNEVFLQEQGLLRMPVLYLSRFLAENRRDYYRVLRKLERDGNWTEYTYFMLTGVRESAEHTRSLILEIHRSLSEAYLRCNEGWYSKELVDLLYSHIYCRPKHLVDAGLVSRNTASAYLRKLEDLGIVRGERVGKGKIYLNLELFKILTKGN